VIDLRVKENKETIIASMNNFAARIGAVLTGISSSQPNVVGRLEEIKAELTSATTGNLTDAVYKKYRNGFEVLSGIQSGLLTLPEGQGQQLQQMLVGLEEQWNYTNIKDAMDFVRDDANLVNYDSRRKVRFFPSSGFVLDVNKENAVKSGIIKASEKNLCLDELRFEFTSRGITREQVMMMDILANNDWKRGIFFSSPGGSEVSISLYQRGYVKQNGMAFELSPLNDLRSRYSADKMYNNLINVYSYGAMSNPDVLTDYYTRRHTSQYRLHFASLAEYYISVADQEDANRGTKEMNIAMLRKNGANAQADELQKSLNGADEKIKTSRKKALDLLKHSLKVMPAEVVIDYGEPTSSRDKYSETGLNLSVYQDGILHDYVALLYRAGDKESAEKLGAEVARQLESIINYFEKSDAYFTGNPENSSDLYAAVDSYFKLYVSAMNPATGDQKGKLAKRTQSKIDQLYKTTLPALYKQLEGKAINNGESTRRGTKAGRYTRMLFELQDYMEAIGVHYGYLEGAKAAPASPEMNMENMDLEELMRQMPIADSVNE
jgi:hypothetical protein